MKNCPRPYWKSYFPWKVTKMHFCCPLMFIIRVLLIHLHLLRSAGWFSIKRLETRYDITKVQGDVIKGSHLCLHPNILNNCRNFNSSHAVRDLGRVRQYPPWLLFAAFVESVGCPRYNPQKTRKQWRTRDRRFHWLWGWFPDLKIIFMM